MTSQDRIGYAVAISMVAEEVWNRGKFPGRSGNGCQEKPAGEPGRLSRLNGDSCGAPEKMNDENEKLDQS